MDSALSRLNACPGKRDLSMAQCADVLDVSERSVRRLCRPDARGHTAIGCRITGIMRKTERYKKYGHGHKVLIPRVDVVIYLARHHTKPDDFMLSLAAQCPDYLPAVKSALSGPHSPVCGSESPPPSNVIPMTGGAKRKSPHARRVCSDHPDQLFLFTA